jgi:hypothetical protein
VYPPVAEVRVCGRSVAVKYVDWDWRPFASVAELISPVLKLKIALVVTRAGEFGSAEPRV